MQSCKFLIHFSSASWTWFVQEELPFLMRKGLLSYCFCHAHKKDKCRHLCLPDQQFLKPNTTLDFSTKSKVTFLPVGLLVWEDSPTHLQVIVTIVIRKKALSRCLWGLPCSCSSGKVLAISKHIQMSWIKPNFRHTQVEMHLPLQLLAPGSCWFFSQASFWPELPSYPVNLLQPHVCSIQTSQRNLLKVL